MQITRNFHFEIARETKDYKLYKNKLISLISRIKFEKIIFSFNAIFEGIGIAGIISAAFWYATAPMAPNGFNGPIATFAIAISTIASLIIAIPIAYSTYKKSINSLDNYYTEFQIESNYFDDSIEELHFELLKLRTLFESDNQFLFEVKSLMHCQMVELIALRVCKIYSIYSDKYYAVRWGSVSELTIYEDVNAFHSMKFMELLKQNSLINSKSFRKAIIKLLFGSILNSEVQQPEFSITKQGKNISYAFVAGITCTEVLLSIGWTVSSILIGIKVIAPISTQSWIVFAFLCIGLGPLFGIGVYFNKLKQINRDSVKNDMRIRNHTINGARDTIDVLFAKRILEQQDLLYRKIDLNPKKTKLRSIKY